MNPVKADNALKDLMRSLALGRGMLTGLTVAFGTRDRQEAFSVGLKREVIKTGNAFTPAPERIDRNTVYDLASLTKLFTLVSVLQLLQQGRLKESDSIREIDRRFIYLKNCTLFDCLCYLGRLQTPQRVDAQPDAQSAERMVFQTRLFPLQGSRCYSDMNALVLKYVVELASGLSFYDYLRRHILHPLGMEETWVVVPDGRQNNLMDYNHEHRVINGEYQIIDSALPGLPHDPKARLLGEGGRSLSGHAGLFSTAGDMCRFAQGLLSGKLLPMETLRGIGVNRTGYLTSVGEYRQFLGMLCFSKSPVARLSEVPSFMGLRAFALAGYTGNHLAIDPDLGVFDLFLGNRCHNRVSLVKPEEQAESLGLSEQGDGKVLWPDGRLVKSSFRYIYQKDRMLHAPVKDCLMERGWLPEYTG